MLASLTGFTSSVSAQSNDYINIGLSDSQEILRRLQDYELLRQVDAEKDKRIQNLEAQVASLNQTVTLDQREIEINQKMLELKDKEIAALNRNFEQMKDIADRALKLAETSKPTSNWQLYGILGLAAFAIGALIAQ